MATGREAHPHPLLLSHRAFGWVPPKKDSPADSTSTPAVCTVRRPSSESKPDCVRTSNPRDGGLAYAHTYWGRHVSHGPWCAFAGGMLVLSHDPPAAVVLHTGGVTVAKQHG